MVRRDRPIKKTVAIQPLVDEYVRETWSLLVKDPHVRDASYSAALNFMLLAAIHEAVNRKRGWTKDTRDIVWGFARDQATLSELKLHETLPLFREYLEEQEFGPQSKG